MVNVKELNNVVNFNFGMVFNVNVLMVILDIMELVDSLLILYQFVNLTLILMELLVHVIKDFMKLIKEIVKDVLLDIFGVEYHVQLIENVLMGMLLM
jgi:hypothetical protein